MTLPLSHPNGASVRQPFNISKNHIADKSANSASTSVVQMPLVEARERYKALFDLGSSARLIITKDLKVIDLNKRFKKWLGLKPPASANPFFLDELMVFKSNTIKELQKKLNALEENGNLDLLADINIGGSYRHVQIAIVPLSLTISDEKRQFVLDISDITELEQNKTGLSESRLLIRTHEAELKKTAKVVSHDLRAPAINISNLIGLLESNEESAIDPELIAGLKTSVRSLIDTLNTTGAELNNCLKQPSANRHITIGSSIQGILDGLNFNREEVNISFESYDNTDWQIPEELLKMVVSQLVSNSIKFGNADSVTEVIITAFKQNGKRIIKINDNGLGINLKGQEQRLFGLFQTFHSHPEARGVGLFQVKNRMKSIGGDVILESEVGVGTTVSLNFN